MGLHSRTQLLKETKPGFYRVWPNLFLCIEEKKSRVYKRWILRYQVKGVRKDVSLGPFPTVSVQRAKYQARQLLDDLVLDQKDPREIADSRQKELAQTKRAQQSNGIDFETIAERFIVKAKRPIWKDGGKSEKQWRQTLEDYAYPIIGHKRFGDVEQADIEAIMMGKDNLWLEKHETASRLLDRIANVLEYHIVKNGLNIRNVAQFKGALEYVLPRYSKPVKHFEALPHDQLPGFWEALNRKNETSHNAIKFTVLTAQRQADVRSARWEQIDLDSGIWDAEIHKRLKGQDTTHRVPLSNQCRDLLEQWYKHRDTDVFLFPGRGENDCVSETAVRKALNIFNRTGAQGRPITLHGFLSSLMEWSQVHNVATTNLVEQHLAHVEKNQVLAAYHRNDLVERRRDLMQRYTDYVHGKVV